MREELNKQLTIGGFSVGQAIDRVEEELRRWKCTQYSHITRATSVRDNRVINLETIFSQPTQNKPVPTAVVFVHFFLDVASHVLTYQFEEECVQHEVDGMSLAPGQFKNWLDRIIGDKLQVRQLHDLATPFERTRLVPPAVYQDEEEQSEAQQEPLSMADKGKESPAASDPEPPEAFAGLEDAAEKLPLSSLLENIFDAADEDSELELTHKEVADLLYATPLGLADWDVKLLLTTATELETGKIEYKPFVQAAPEIVEALLKRRVAFEERMQAKNAAKVPMDAIELCYGEEIEEVGRAAREAFAARDASSEGLLSRHDFRTCLSQRSDRFSEQEVQMLMQMCKEDDFGFVGYQDIDSLLLQLRMDALHNAPVETDVQALMIHLIRLCHMEGMTTDNILYIWELRNVLLHADQLCLSRMQIHVILMIVHPNENGEVDVEYFLRVCCTVIPYMFDTIAFAETAAQIQKDKQDAIAKQELEELQGFAGGGMKRSTLNDEEQEDSQANAPDREAVEKELIQKAKADEYPVAGKFMNLMQGDSLAHLQLSDSELRGFIAEAEFNDQGKMALVDHIRTWVPIMFELRKARIYEPVLTKDWGADATHLVDISELGARQWMRPPADDVDDESDRSVTSQMSRKSSRRLRRQGSKKDGTIAVGRSSSRSGKRGSKSMGSKSMGSKSLGSKQSRAGSRSSAAQSVESDSDASAASSRSARSTSSRTSQRGRGPGSKPTAKAKEAKADRKFSKASRAMSKGRKAL